MALALLRILTKATRRSRVHLASRFLGDLGVGVCDLRKTQQAIGFALLYGRLAPLPAWRPSLLTAKLAQAGCFGIWIILEQLEWTSQGQTQLQDLSLHPPSIV